MGIILANVFWFAVMVIRRNMMENKAMPTYTKGEEIFNMVSHIVGGGIGVIALIGCIVAAVINRSGVGLLTGVVFGISMIALYTVSSIYHGLRQGTAKRVFRILDHCTIYFLIAGTYTPILLCKLVDVTPVGTWIIFSAVWGLAVLAITLTAIDMNKFKVFGMLCYVGMGWAIIFSIDKALIALGSVGFSLLLGGGILYTVGVIFYGIGKKKKYFHSIFHLFVLLGSILQALSVIFYTI